MSAARKLDVSSSFTSAWLVKVPIDIADSWVRCCEQSMDPNLDMESTAQLQLGHFVREFTEENGQEVETNYVELADTVENQRLPKRLRVHKLPVDKSSVSHIISFGQPNPLSPDIEEPRVEGVVTERMDLVLPMDAWSKDPQYVKLLEKRNIDSQNTRSVTLHNVTVRDHLDNVKRIRQINNEARRRETELKVQMEANRRVKLEKEPLQQELFKLFERHSAWTFKQLVTETEQPQTWLKEVLEGSKENPSDGIAVKEKRGPNKDKYVLKFEYRPEEERRSAAASQLGYR
mmetsp:Transcript_29398/g.53943  ORF Transcript_29398/g.53943 Transcript_29398/m.53943 type:complete len:289 (-) Transcript_29398:230-1096(-)|eukprot:CAMPEP_0175062506 /NCGR_PEP_ID=MMETSP0052_2-20121109/14207_1 /TAXON_ID=51329 ORGANISM="Polytomella parva, Strain SAG 63-3" /NCGR_SAMPLE_ID=MMETSP0052_2 /ASSEMBLY_ACC=CAM_ASM_000194 /LENGTH=288 /DNA_ID=CAMNT_0016328537 /DNA_START=27 /DNA_END=893 /DNA_ORIENTATION=-